MSGLAFGLVAAVAVPVALISAAQAPRTAHPHVQVSHPSVPHKPADAVHREGHEAQQTTQQADERRRELERRIEDLKQQLAAELDKKKVAVEQTMKHAEAEFAKNADLHRKMIEEAAVEFEKVARANHAGTSHAGEVQAQAATTAEIAAARQRYEEARKLFEKGLTTRTQLLEAEAALAKLQARGNTEATAAIELQLAMEKLARSRQLVEKGLMAPRDLAELEAQLANLQQRLVTTRTAREARARELQANANDARRLHELLVDRTAANAANAQDRAAMAERLMHLQVNVETEALAATEPARAGDTLRITIEGEPDLPSSYRVRDDGTIRLPFVGVLKVSGLNATQVRDALGKQLSDRKLGSTSQVKVTVSRPRGAAK